jgi:hypothetical protein
MNQIQTQIQHQSQVQLQKIGTMFDTKTTQVLTQAMIQAQAQSQIQKQLQTPIQKLEPQPLQTPIQKLEPQLLKKPPIRIRIDLDPGKKIRSIIEPVAFDVYVKKRQWVDGERIRGTEWEKANPHPLTRYDALSLGSTIIDNTAKASFKIKQTTGKPKSLRRKVTSWGMVQHEYSEKRPNYLVEESLFRIDSPGELKEITMRGIEANRRKGKTSSKKRGFPTDKASSKALSIPRSVENVNKYVERQVNKMLRI